MEDFLDEVAVATAAAVEEALEDIEPDVEFADDDVEELNAGALLQPAFPRPDVTDWACEVSPFLSDTKTGREKEIKGLVWLDVSNGAVLTCECVSPQDNVGHRERVRRNSHQVRHDVGSTI